MPRLARHLSGTSTTTPTQRCNFAVSLSDASELGHRTDGCARAAQCKLFFISKPSNNHAATVQVGTRREQPTRPPSRDAFIHKGAGPAIGTNRFALGDVKRASLSVSLRRMSAAAQTHGRARPLPSKPPSARSSSMGLPQVASRSTKSSPCMIVRALTNTPNLRASTAAGGLFFCW